MGDSGEGLIDAEARIQDRMDERAAERVQPRKTAAIDPEKHREMESLKLAHAQIEQQVAAASHPLHRQQLELALKDIDERLAAISGRGA